MDEFATSYEYDSGSPDKPRRGGAPRFFTLPEANRALVLVERIVADVLCEYLRLNDLQETIEAAQESGKYDTARAARDELVESVDRVHTHVDELEDVGADLKDWTLGVVDFPCIAGGREVALCWQAGEEGIRFWHDPDAGCAERKPLETLPGMPMVASVRKS